MANLNKVLLIGNVGNDPEVRYLESQNPGSNAKVASFRLATTDGVPLSVPGKGEVLICAGLAERFHLNEGDTIRVDTRTGEYMSRL